MDPKELVGIRITPKHHDALKKLALKRSFEIGRQVGMGFVIEELINERLQLENPEQRDTDLFAAHD
jgi:hypothetical protein